MELFIRLKDGVPFEHPLIKSNVLEAFPDLNLDNLPEWLAKFERVSLPGVGIYEVYEGVTYEKVGDIFKDVHRVRPMTSEEKANRIQEIKDKYNSDKYSSNFSAWIFIEEKGVFEPPIARPEIEPEKASLFIDYYWSGADNSWKETPPYPQDQKLYIFNPIDWVWEEVT
jgi:hypothetical protein